MEQMAQMTALCRVNKQAVTSVKSCCCLSLIKVYLALNGPVRLLHNPLFKLVFKMLAIRFS